MINETKATQTKEAEMTNPAEIKVNDFIRIPAWNTAGLVWGTGNVIMGNDDARLITIQESPDSDNTRVFTVAPGEFEWE